MLKIACYCVVLAAATSLCSQVEPSVAGASAADDGISLDGTRMMTPPPVSGQAYPVIAGSEARSNYFAAGLAFTGAYTDNLLLTEGESPVADETYTILPTIGYNRNTPRQRENFNYSPGFTVYQTNSQLNSVAQSASANYQFRISRFLVVNLGDAFQQNNNIYNQANPFIGAGVSGTPGTPNTNLISPFQNQLANISTAGIDYQYGKNGMIGGSGTYSFQNYSESAYSAGINNENTAGANGFFSRRIARSSYVGVSYQFSKFVTHPVDTYTVTHTLFGFYTLYLTRSFSVSIMGGPEHYTTWSPDVASQGSWTPAVQGSVGWQVLRANVAATYSHTVSGAGGLIGVYHSDIADLNGRFLFSRAWSIGGNMNYSLNDNVSSISVGTGGKSFFGGVYAERRFTERLNAQAGYGHFYQNYADVSAAPTFPNSNRVYGSIMYELNRPLGR